jgi:hypothetical protein
VFVRFSAVAGQLGSAATVRNARVPTWMVERGEIGRYASDLNASAPTVPRSLLALTASYFYGVASSGWQVRTIAERSRLLNIRSKGAHHE